MTKLSGSSELVGQVVPALPAPGLRLRGVMQAGSRIVLGWMDRSAQRRALADLDDRLLDDLGITRSAAACEIAKPFWR